MSKLLTPEQIAGFKAGLKFPFKPPVEKRTKFMDKRGRFYYWPLPLKVPTAKGQPKPYKTISDPKKRNAFAYQGSYAKAMKANAAKKKVADAFVGL